jgi:hypothetical protein
VAVPVTACHVLRQLVAWHIVLHAQSIGTNDCVPPQSQGPLIIMPTEFCNLYLYLYLYLYLLPAAASCYSAFEHTPLRAFHTCTSQHCSRQRQLALYRATGPVHFTGWSHLLGNTHTDTWCWSNECRYRLKYVHTR